MWSRADDTDFFCSKKTGVKNLLYGPAGAGCSPSMFSGEPLTWPVLDFLQEIIYPLHYALCRGDLVCFVVASHACLERWGYFFVRSSHSVIRLRFDFDYIVNLKNEFENAIILVRYCSSHRIHVSTCLAPVPTSHC